MNLKPWKHVFEKPTFGCFVTFPSPGLSEFTACLGFDFTLIDNEHTSISNGTLEDMVRASQSVDTPCVVRVRRNTYDNIQTALDSGANGVQVPMVNSVEEAIQAVQFANFPPLGQRGVAHGSRSARFGTRTISKPEYLERANECKFLGIHIETLEAVACLDDMLKVDGIDMYFVGPSDLSGSMELPPGHPEVWKITEECIRKIHAAGKIAGTVTTDVKSTREAISWGATYIITAINGYLVNAVGDYLAGVKEYRK